MRYVKRPTRACAVCNRERDRLRDYGLNRFKTQSKTCRECLTPQPRPRRRLRGPPDLSYWK